ncbi:anti-sigma regulatory factor (Ser/Thr protein kinase) [Amycolatopsis lexingtonensis]|uniref:Anti-sigma regulatory factor (Ser/Thr protein kinase) n=1 Tax=Amycolatopsis lexingtonensis TaxID=218822 RepID=A0ABR9HQ64_9PSEU|nr:ATP-binding protein [Amycolatopsis lexingtonensis]MBE1493073.1 anti-sigma regulatory factor (Ser/Thr protein kinase) [Amycolatopsis lexingtonensis]
MYRHTPHTGVDTGESADADQTGTTAPARGGAEAVVVPPFEELAPALPNEMADLRRKLTRWLGELPLDAESTHDIILATYEALANVAAHAYPGGHGWARLQATRTGDTVTVTVTDTGCGIPATRPRTAGLRTSGGRGLVLIDKVTDQSDIDTGDTGTTVRMTWRPVSLRDAS